MGMDGFTMDQGAMCRDLERAEVMREFARQAETVYFLSDSSKLGRKAVRTICSPENIDCLITDRALEEKYKQFFHDKNISLLTT